MNIRKHQFATSKDTGFTIVELLIAIVVIAILAAISVVAYNGIQQRARSSAIKSEMSQLQKKIQVDAIQYNDESVSLNAPLAYGKDVGSWSLAEPLRNVQKLTMYSVFNTSNNMDANWASISRLEPTSSSNYFSIRSTASATNCVQGFWQTSMQQNQSVTTACNVRNTTGRHVGWITADGSAIYAGFDNGAGSSVNPTAHNGWTFDTVVSVNSAGVAPMAVLVFPEYHDATTRAQVLKWLDREYAIDYFD